jgi:hypothetical protein
LQLKREFLEAAAGVQSEIASRVIREFIIDSHSCK